MDDTVTYTRVTQITTETVVMGRQGLPSPVVRRAIVALLDAREFLGYQLTHAQGAIDDAELDDIADKYLRQDSWSDDELANDVAALAEIISDRLDADVISTVFACDPIQAQRVLKRVAAQDAMRLLSAVEAPSFVGRPRTAGISAAPDNAFSITAQADTTTGGGQ